MSLKKFRLLAVSCWLLALWSCHSANENKEKLTMVVSVEKMNVLYIGVDNPITVSVSGFPFDKVSVKMEDGKITGSNGQYMVNVASPGGAKIEVFAEMDNGEKKSAGIAFFRTKYVPDPVVYFAGKKGEDIVSKAELEKADKVETRMENFDFDLHFDVTSFDIEVTEGGNSKTMSSNSSSLTDEMKQVLSQIQSGAHVIVQNIKTKGSDGSARKVPGLNLTVL